MTAAPFPFTRRALEILLPGADGAALPVADLVASAAHRAPPAAGAPCDPADWLPAAAVLAADLRALGLSIDPAAPPLLELALLVDGLDPEGPSPLARDLHRRILRREEAPLDHAACLLGQGDATRWALLGLPETSALLAERAATLVAALDPTHGVLGRALMVALDERRLRLSFAAMTARLTQPRPAVRFTAALAHALARAAPAPHLRARCRAAWEINRSGVEGHARLQGDLFVPLLVLEALARAGREVRRPLAAVLRARLGDGLRYYRASPWMPHDADDAAAVLLALAAAGGAGAATAPLEAEALAVLAHAREPDGALRTWVELPGERAEPPAEAWHGQICSGVAARALRALCWRTSAGGAASLRGSLAWLVDRADPDGGFTGAYYPSRVLTTALVVECLATARAMRLLRAAGVTALERACAWLQVRQDPDGSFTGSALDTAAALLALEVAGRLPMSLAADAAAWLTRAQRCDGDWPADDFFLTPQGDGRLGPFGSAPLSSAMALAALARGGTTLAPWLAAPAPA